MIRLRARVRLGSGLGLGSGGTARELTSCRKDPLNEVLVIDK